MRQHLAMDRIVGLTPLSPDELARVSGGAVAGNPLMRILGHAAEKMVDCLFDEWNTIVDCFNQGRASARG